MAEPQAASSRVSAGMMISFAITSPTNANLDEAPPRDLQHWPSAAGNPRRFNMQGDYAVNRDTVPHPGDNVAFVSRDNRERGHAAVGGNRVQASSGRTAPVPAPLLAGAGRNLGPIATAEATAARDDWSPRGWSSHRRGRRERESQHVAEHAATSRGGFQSQIFHSAGGVATVATVGGGNQGSSDGVPIMCAVRRTSGGARDTRRARPRKARAEKPCVRDDAHQHFGVKRIRPLEGIDNRDEEQGDEGRRVSSPHRLIRRNGVVASTNSTRNIPQAGSNLTSAMPRQSAGLSARSASLAEGTVSNRGITSHTSRRSPRNSTPRDLINSPAMRQDGGQSENSIGSVMRTGREAASGEIGEGASHCLDHHGVRTPNEPTLFADSTWITDGSSSTGLRCRPRHRSLKVQRLNTNPMESLTSGVRSLGVISPATPPPDLSDGNVDHHGSDGAPATNASLVRGMAVSGTVQVENMVSTVQPPLSQALDSALGVRSVGARAGELVDGGHAAFHVPSRRSDRPLATDPALSDASGTSIARSSPAAARGPSTIDRRQQNHHHNKHVRRTASARSCTTKEGGVVGMDVAADGGRGDCPSTCSSIASVDAMTTPTMGSSKAAPRFDAAVPCSPSSSPTGIVVQAGGAHDERRRGVGGGDSDGESSDGGAAHEEISVWLHSTDDWWTCD